MRLLYLEENDHLGLREYVDEREAPAYAILSHRWGPDHEEVTLKDIEEDTGREKKGHQKIINCGKQAREDGVKFFWVDTCCIDKTSSAELSESINSMWRWYRESKICYAYLNDVSAGLDRRDMYTKLASSKWFTRGWTLQELLAPFKLILYDEEWTSLGTRDEMATEISTITGIDRCYLCHEKSLERACVAEKMSWAAQRNTKRAEDVAYSLLGIFEINMPLLYGEGDRAFERLQLEIMKQTDDHSILAWNARMFDNSLARTPAAFRNSRNIVQSVRPDSTRPYTMTNRGLQIDLPLVEVCGKLYAALNCRNSDDFFSDLAIPLRQIEHGRRYQRTHGPVLSIPLDKLRHTKPQSIFIVNRSSDPLSIVDAIGPSIVVGTVPRGWKVKHIASLAPRNEGDAFAAVSIVSDTSDEIEIHVHRRQRTIFGTLGACVSRHQTSGRIIPAGKVRQHLSQKVAQSSASTQTVDMNLIHARASERFVRDKTRTVVDLVICRTQYHALCLNCASHIVMSTRTIIKSSITFINSIIRHARWYPRGHAGLFCSIIIALCIWTNRYSLIGVALLVDTILTSGPELLPLWGDIPNWHD